MKTLAHGSWGHYFLLGMSAVLLSWLVSGCRFGNRVEFSLKDDGVTGLYGMQAQNAQFCFRSLSSQNTQCVSGPISSIPTGSSNIMTHPLYVQYHSSKNPVDLIAAGNSTNPNRPSLQVTLSKSQKTVKTSGIISQVTAMLDPLCIGRLELSIDGQWDSDNKEETPYGKTRGRLSLDYEVFMNYSAVDNGDCQSTMTLVHACYLDAQNCGAGDPEENQTWHEFWINELALFIDSGAMTVNDIPDLGGYGFRVEYR